MPSALEKNPASLHKLTVRMKASTTCALPGCSKPSCPSPGRAEPHLTCGDLHHQLLMAARFNPALPHPHQQILDSNAAGLCALPSCQDPPSPDDSWCLPSHYLRWLSDFTSSLLPEQICKLPGCFRHVFVNNNSKPWEFCGWRHRQKYVMRSALERQQKPLPQQQYEPSMERKCGEVPSIGSLLCSLKEYALHAKCPTNVEVDEDFFNKHPWDVCTEDGHTFLLIVKSKYTNKGKRVMVTKDNYHWKQQGPRVNKDTLTVKYFTYMELKGKQAEAADLHDECTYFMEEYSIDPVRHFALIKVRRKSNGKQRKGRPITGNKRSRAAEVNDVCPQYTKGDEMDADSLSWNLPTLLELDQLSALSEGTGTEVF